MITTHTRNQIRRANLLMDALTDIQPSSYPIKTRRFSAIVKSLGKMVYHMSHTGCPITASFSQKHCKH